MLSTLLKLKNSVATLHSDSFDINWHTLIDITPLESDMWIITIVALILGIYFIYEIMECGIKVLSVMKRAQ